MTEKDIIITNDINEVAAIHSNPKYVSWRYEVVGNEYRFYSPNYKKPTTVIFYHGGAEPDFDITKLDVLRSGEKQRKRKSNYAGFYMYGEPNYINAIQYAVQENRLKNTDTKGILKITMTNDLNIYNVAPGVITRIPKERIQQLQQQGYDVISGNMIGKIEYVLLNKNKIIDIQFQSLESIELNTLEQSNDDNKPSNTQETKRSDKSR